MSTLLESDYLSVCIVCLCVILVTPTGGSCITNSAPLTCNQSIEQLSFKSTWKKIKIHFHCRIMYAYVSNHFCQSLYCAHRRIAQAPALIEMEKKFQKTNENTQSYHKRKKKEKYTEIYGYRSFDSSIVIYSVCFYISIASAFNATNNLSFVCPIYVCVHGSSLNELTWTSKNISPFSYFLKRNFFSLSFAVCVPIVFARPNKLCIITPNDALLPLFFFFL